MTQCYLLQQLLHTVFFLQHIYMYVSSKPPLRIPAHHSTGPVQAPKIPAAATPPTPLPLPWGKGCVSWTLAREWLSMLALPESVPLYSLPGYT